MQSWRRGRSSARARTARAYAGGMMVGRMRGRLSVGKRTVGTGQGAGCARTARWILGGIAVVLAGVAGWRWWQARLDAGRLEAGATLHADGAVARARRPHARRWCCSGSWSARHAGSPYVDQAQLLAARVYVDGGELDKAAQRTRRRGRALQGSRAGAGRAAAPGARADRAGQARCGARHARCQPTAVRSPSRYHEVRGDAYYAKGDKAAALQRVPQRAGGPTAAAARRCWT